MARKRNKSPDPKGLSFLHVRASETEATHLAHWPPPRHDRESPAALKIKRPDAEPVKRAKLRGWRLTRAIFSEFSDDEQ